MKKVMEYKLLRDGVYLSAIGLGAMPLSLNERPSEEQAINVIHHALDLGVNFIDTADAYCIDESDKHHNEKLIAKALSLYKNQAKADEVIVATKGGLIRPNGAWELNGNPEHIRKTIRESFNALGGKKPIQIWQMHAIDPKYTIEESLGPVKEAVDEGLIRFVGVSNFDVNEIQRAQKVVPIVSVQNQFNPWFRKSEFNGVLEYCEKNNILFLPWSPVGGGYRYKKLLECKPIVDVAEKYGCTVYALILAWIRQKSPCVLSIPGASKIESIQNSVDSLKIHLTNDDMKYIDSISENLRHEKGGDLSSSSYW